MGATHTIERELAGTPESQPFSARVHAGFWSFALRVTQRLFTTARTIILATLLAPGDFGLMGIALMMLSLLDSFTTTGLGAALIQRKDDIRPYLNTAWTVNVFRGLVMAVGLVLIAPLVAGFFETPAAASIVRIMAIVVLISAFENIGMVYVLKELESQKRFVYLALTVAAEVGVGIGLALHNVWALVYGAMAGGAVRVIASVLHPYRPRPHFYWVGFRELYRFGKRMIGMSTLRYLSRNIDGFFIGRFLEITAFGLYRRAFTLSQLVTVETITVINGVIFPAYAKLQDQPTNGHR